MTTIATTDVFGRTTGRRCFLLLAALATGLGLVVAPGLVSADEKKVDETLKAIQGTWVPTDGSSIDSKWAFDGDNLKTSVNGVDYVCKITVDPKATPHATVDLAIKDGPDEAKGQTSKAIYKVDGEKLILCVALPGRDRPSKFEQDGDDAYLFELKKEKKS